MSSNNVHTTVLGGARRLFSVPLLLAAAAMIAVGCDKGAERSGSGAPPAAPVESKQAGQGEIQPGQKAVEFRRTGINGEFAGKEYGLSDIPAKLILLNFWATWCAPCVAEMPALQRLHVALSERGFAVVSINVDPASAHDDVRKFVQDHGLTFAVLADPDLELPPKFGLTGFPESFFIDSEGRHVAFLDPLTKKKQTRIVSDREWDSPAYIAAISSLLESLDGADAAAVE